MNSSSSFSFISLNSFLLTSNLLIFPLTSVISLSDSAKKVKPLQVKVDSLTEALNAKENIVNTLNARIQKLTESVRAAETTKTKLNEEFSSKATSMKTKLEESLQQNVKLQEQVKEEEAKNSSLRERIETLHKDASLKANDYKESLTKASKIVEHYKQVANEASDYYISAKAATLGISAQEIKNRLAEKFTFDDVNTVCNDIRNYQLNVSKLPFDLKRSKIRVTESKETMTNAIKANQDDDIDDQLLGLANSIIKK